MQLTRLRAFEVGAATGFVFAPCSRLFRWAVPLSNAAPLTSGGQSTRSRSSSLLSTHLPIQRRQGSGIRSRPDTASDYLPEQRYSHSATSLSVTDAPQRPPVTESRTLSEPRVHLRSASELRVDDILTAPSAPGGQTSGSYSSVLPSPPPLSRSSVSTTSSPGPISTAPHLSLDAIISLRTLASPASSFGLALPTSPQPCATAPLPKMRYDDWDILLFPRDCKTPMKEFKVACHVVHDAGTSATGPEASCKPLIALSLRVLSYPRFHRSANGLLLCPEPGIWNSLPDLDPFLVRPSCEPVHQILQQVYRDGQVRSETIHRRTTGRVCYVPNFPWQAPRLTLA